MIPILAAVSGSALFQVVLWVICAALVFWLLSWLIDYIQLPEPFAKVARVLLAVAAVFVLVNAIMSFAGHPMIRW